MQDFNCFSVLNILKFPLWFSLYPMAHVKVVLRSPSDVFLFSRYFVGFQFNSIGLISYRPDIILWNLLRLPWESMTWSVFVNFWCVLKKEYSLGHLMQVQNMNSHHHVDQKSTSFSKKKAYIILDVLSYKCLLKYNNVLWKYSHVNMYDLIHILNYFIIVNFLCGIGPSKDVIFKKAHELLSWICICHFTPFSPIAHFWSLPEHCMLCFYLRWRSNCSSSPRGSGTLRDVQQFPEHGRGSQVWVLPPTSCPEEGLDEWQNPAMNSRTILPCPAPARLTLWEGEALLQRGESGLPTPVPHAGHRARQIFSAKCIFLAGSWRMIAFLWSSPGPC